MFCSKHPQLFADKCCTKCSKWSCYICCKVVGGKLLCNDCASSQFTFSEEKPPEKTFHYENPNFKFQVSASLTGQGMVIPWNARKPVTRKNYCVNHPDAETDKKCSRCNNYVCSRCLRVEEQAENICYICWYKMPVSGEDLEDIYGNIDDVICGDEKNIPPELLALLEEDEEIKLEVKVIDKEEKKEDVKKKNGYERDLHSSKLDDASNWFVDLSFDKEEALKQEEAKSYKEEIILAHDEKKYHKTEIIDKDFSDLFKAIEASPDEYVSEIAHHLEEIIPEETIPDSNIISELIEERDEEKIVLEIEASKDGKEKIQLFEELINIDSKSATEYLARNGLSDIDREVRIKAAELLSVKKDEIALPYLLDGIKSEKDSQVRKTIAMAYSRVKYNK